MCRVLKPKKPRDQKVHCWHHLRGGCRRGDKCNFYHKGENEEVGDCPDYLEGKCAFGEQCMKGHHDESKLAMQTPPQKEQHFESNAELENIVEHLDEVEARSGPSAKRRLSMHSSEGAVSEGQCQRRGQGGGRSFWGGGEGPHHQRYCDRHHEDECRIECKA